MAVIDSGSSTAGKANVNSTYDLQVALPDATVTNRVGAVRMFSENSPVGIRANADLLSPETDNDYRIRASLDTPLDEEIFNYTAQNTGKHTFAATTMTAAWSAGALTTNSGSITTTTTGMTFGTYAHFPNVGTNTLSCDMQASFSSQPVANTIIDFGMFIRGAANPYTPLDGIYFRLSSSGLQGIANSNGTENTTGVFPLSGGTGTWVYTTGKSYQFIVYCGGITADFWVNDGTGAQKLGSIPLPTALKRMTLSGSLPFSLRHAITGGAAGGVMQMALGAYNVRLGGANITTTPCTAGNRMYGSYQGMSGGTMGSLANYANSANPVAAVPTNTTAALGTGLGGQFWQTFTLAVNTDGIICSFQNPAGTVNVPGRRLVIRGVSLQSYVQTVLAGGPCVTQYSLAFGHTAVSLATAEGTASKASRRVPLARLTQAVTAAQAVSTMISCPGGGEHDFGDAPIYVNPGEFVALVAKHVGTVGTSGTIAHVVTFAYGWE
jgi:hypothetical protein